MNADAEAVAAALSLVRVRWAAVPATMPRRGVAHALVRTLLAEAGERSVALSQTCPRCGGPHGPVEIDPATWRASVTYAAAWAIVAVAPATGIEAIGVDAEPWHDPRRDGAGWRGLLADGAAGARAWTRVEASLKADGRGLLVDPALVRIREEDSGWLAALPASRPLYGLDVPGPDDVAVSVAVRTAAAPASDRARR